MGALRFLAICIVLIPGVGAQLPPIFDLSDPPGQEGVRITRIYGDVVNGSHAGMRCERVAVGDFNGDGVDDCAIGSPHANTVNGEGMGKVIIIFGGVGLEKETEWFLQEKLFGFHTAQIIGVNPQSLFGLSVASGDFNADGFDDLAIGAPGDDPDQGNTQGAVHLVYGNSEMAHLGIVSVDETAGSFSHLLLSGFNEGDHAGLSVACGDVNGDGFDDTVIGAPFANSLDGKVYVVFGNESLDAMGFETQTFVGGREAGHSVAVGDVNGDGFDDVIFGSPYTDNRKGRVTVAHGGATLVERISLGQMILNGGGREAGSRVTSGDLNGDGFDDIVIGAPYSSSFSWNTAGRAVVFQGSQSTPGTNIDLNQSPGSHGETVFIGGDQSDYLGASICCADINGDGMRDLLLGSQMLKPRGGGEIGELSVVFGDEAFAATSPLDFETQSPAVWGWGANYADLFAESLGGNGDFNGDGIGDLVAVSNNGDNPNLGVNNNAGVAYLIYGEAVDSRAEVSRFTRTGDGVGGNVVASADFGPVVRCEIDFSDDDLADNGSGGASLTSATVVRGGGESLSVPGPLLSRVHWELATDRQNWGSAEITFHFVNSEVAGYRKDSLSVFQSDTAGGPFTELVTEVDVLRNELKVTVTELGVFVIAGELSVVGTVLE